MQTIMNIKRMYFCPDSIKFLVDNLCIRDLGFGDSMTSLTIGKQGADPGFLECGFICIKVWGFALLI